jgi:class 3 adenylate cyclase/tetratricopeptide (TPR) repeat protein
VQLCAECGQENPEGARFCNACGGSLIEAAPAREVRKTVTVLFCDVTGSTALGESLDPEPLRALLARYFERMKGIVERHGGSVEKFIGDAVMAVFGVPAVHEDDALRALRAAVEMREAFPELGIEGRIGVNTGEVVTGTEERLATGDAVNVAARLEQAAQPGEILVGEATVNLARDAAEVEPVEPLQLTGKSEPLRAFRLVGVREGAPAFALRLDSPMVGRARERQLLRQAFERSRDERGCHLFTILGPAGIGKSRLVGELLDSVEDEATVVTGRCLSYGEGITYWPLLEVLEPLGRELEIGMPEETAWAARKLFEEIAAERPLVVVFDDIQWAETTVLDLIEHIADLSRDAPILLLCVARPELLDARPAWGGGKLNATTILVEPLGEIEVGELVANLLDRAELPGDVLRRVEEAAEGNPLFVEEMLAMISEDGHNGEIDVPPTIQALLAARLDRLAPAERDVLGRASVEGKVFHAGGVATLGPDELRPAVRGYLTGLVRKELIRPDRPAFADQDAFRFRHLLIRDAAYQSLPKEQRADLHERFADWLEKVAQDEAAEYEAIVGYHLEQAHRYRRELGQARDEMCELGRRAGRRLADAGARAFFAGDLPTAANLLGRAVDLLPEDDLDRLAPLATLGEALAQMGELERAGEVLAAAISGAATAGQKTVEARAVVSRAFLRMAADPDGATEDARAEVARLLPEVEELGDDLALAYVWHLMGHVHLMGCRFAELAEAGERALLHARRAEDRRQEGEMVFWTLAGYNFGPLPVDEAIARAEKLLSASTGNRVAESGALAHLAMLQAKGGDFDTARSMYARALAIVEELGMRVHLSGLAMGFGWIELLAGTPDAAEPVLRRADALLEEIGEKSYRSTAAAVLAEVVYQQDRYVEAEELTRLSEELAAPDDLASQIGWRSVRAKALARRGQFAEADRLGLEAVEIAARTDGLDWQADALIDLAEVLRLAGRPDEAAARLQEALLLQEAKGVVPAVERTRALLAELGQPPATA